MTTNEDNYEECARNCTVCGASVEGYDTLLLNRYAAGAANGGHVACAHDMWVEGIGDEPDQFSGDLLHWPICANMFIDGVIAEERAGAPMRKREEQQ